MPGYSTGIEVNEVAINKQHPNSRLQANSRMDAMTWRGKAAAFSRHFNGTCVCYVAPGTGINGTRESGKNCAVSCLNNADYEGWKARIRMWQIRNGR